MHDFMVINVKRKKAGQSPPNGSKIQFNRLKHGQVGTPPISPDYSI